MKPRLPSQTPAANAGRKDKARHSVDTLSRPFQPCQPSAIKSVSRKKAIIEARPTATPAGELKKNRITGGPPIPKPPFKRPDATPVAKVAPGPGTDGRAWPRASSTAAIRTKPASASVIGAAGTCASAYTPNGVP